MIKPLKYADRLEDTRRNQVQFHGANNLYY